MTPVQTVAVIGGGVAGLSAAHELAERGFRVELYESMPTFGGKARSDLAHGPPGLPANGVTVPNEHGFRFFPRFYQHVTDTMARIPVQPGRSVYDALVQSRHALIARDGQPPIQVPVRFPSSVGDLADWVQLLANGTNTGLNPGEAEDFAFKIWQLMTSCRDRVLTEYDARSWWDFTDADNHSVTYQTLLVEGLSHSLVAAGAHDASTSAGGVILTQLFYSLLRPGRSADTVLDGPTTTVWLDLWRTLLASLTVRFVPDSPAVQVVMRNGEVSEVRLANSTRVTADYYVFAVPVEQMAPLVTADMTAADPGLSVLAALGAETQWMTGIQFYLRADTPVVDGHVVYIDSPWAITSISQAQFWGGIIPGGNGQVADILSVDVSNWDRDGLFIPRPGGGYKTAKECTADEIIIEVWEQLKRSLNIGGKTVLTDDNRYGWSIDPAIVFGPTHPGDPPTPQSNAKPLFINMPGAYPTRPEATTAIPNLFLASDYVKTNTNLATMEAANEAARRAVNGILRHARALDPGAHYDDCEIWPLYAPALLAPFRWYDQWRFDRGLPWKRPPWLLRAVMNPAIRVHRTTTRATRAVHAVVTRRKRPPSTKGHPRAIA